jgi:hypothetical protein
MACGLPVVATDVGGNAQVVAHAGLGRIVPFGNAVALTAALKESLTEQWDRRAIRAYAETNSWDARIPQVVAVFDDVLGHVGQADAQHEVRRFDRIDPPHESRSNAPSHAARGGGVPQPEPHDAG